MLRRYLFPALAASALVVIGCVPVTEPVGDIDKTEPNKALVGKWTVTKGRGFAELVKTGSLVFDIPDVKGNPKGLMCETANDQSTIWFFTTAGKNTYANVILDAGGSTPPQFDKQGEFVKWKKEEAKRYFVFKYVLDGDKLTIDCGSFDTFSALMKDEKIGDDGRKHVPFFYTPAGWLAKYLDKNDPDKLFDGTNALTLEREKKK